MIDQFRAFRAEKIVGDDTYELSLDSDATIIVGPNGTGKSTLLSVFYLFITRQWSRLLQYKFSKLSLLLENGEISISRADLFSVDSLSLSKVAPRVQSLLGRLVQTPYLGQFLSGANFTPNEIALVSGLLDIPIEEFVPFRQYIVRQTKDLFDEAFLDVERKLVEIKLPKVLYLPTYRRIEKDLKSILPDIEERMRSRAVEGSMFARQGQSFAEIVSFGMEDIGKMISEFTAKLNTVAKNKSNSAAQEYIRDMVQGRIKDYSIGSIRDIPPTIIGEFVDRLDNQLLSLDDKQRLRADIDKLKKRSVGKPTKDMQYLGFFVEKMLQVYLDLKDEEAPLVQFATVVQKYFTNKIINYNNYNLNIFDLHENPIQLNDLSSGEKQILSIFAYLLLTTDPSYLVFIDEPELSLSVPWQKAFLPDILDTARCKMLLAVSHSPFVFDNELRGQIVDVRKLRKHAVG
ncbi:AAA family ATPase [Bradyrhizobium manausense]|uniref:AAA family ATPase n=1 Tax=Bradyrhizobium manausense TaxID=989370 RepID=UPI001BABCD16|nr:AAA family ATPase [Bradyrhizobium manausense]MBR1089560.1 AAA family ATPase [Bradyrhizobium manausense]